MRVLFYLYPALLSQGPDFNGGWSLLMARIMRGLVSAVQGECRMITALRFKHLLDPHADGLSVAYVDELELHRHIRETDVKSSIPTELSRQARAKEGAEYPSVTRLLEHILKASAGFDPDVIITFSMQADYLKTIWPDAHIFYVEAGAFSRSPYPFTLFFDHQGMYGQSVAAQLPGDDVAVSGAALALAKDIRTHAAQLLAQGDPFKAFDFRQRYERLALLPLQVSNYFSFDEQGPYRTQFEYLLDVLTTAPRDVGIVVAEYIQWGEVLQSEGGAANIAWLSKTFPNFIFQEEFRKYTSPSQYLVAHVDGVLSIASNLGYQALLFGKRLGTGPNSYLKNVAHDLDLTHFFNNLNHAVPAADRLHFLAWYIERYAVPESLFVDGHWFSDYLGRRVKAIESATTAQDGFVPIAPNHVLRDLWIKQASHKPADRWETGAARLIRQSATEDIGRARTEGKMAALRPHPNAISECTNGKYILLNETRLMADHLHLGGNAVARYIEKSMALAGLDCLGSASSAEECNALLSSPHIDQLKLIVLNGEGSAHHDSSRIRDLMLFCMAMKERAIPCVLINTVWYENSPVLGELLDYFDIVAVRESHSMQAIQVWRPDARLVPDISFAAFAEQDSAFEGQLTRPVISSPLAVIDSVNSTVAGQLAAFGEFHRFPVYLMGDSHIDALVRHAGSGFQLDGTSYPRILRSPQELTFSDACLTGRFHGLAAAMCAAVPVVALPSTTRKIEGLLNDAGIGDHALLDHDWLGQGRNKQRDSVERLLSSWGRRTHQAVAVYTSSAREAIEQLFEDIAALALTTLQRPAAEAALAIGE